jgi:mannose-1-phosphate guanylyltransferase / mannose-6-phosphate isomerase
MRIESLRPVILAGGSGTRLWPVSRSLYPKQFAALTGDRSLFEQTLQRLSDLGLSDPIIVGNEEHRFIIAEQLRRAGVDRHTILLEPEGRNTTAAIGLAAQFAIAKDPDAALIVVPSDHWIGNTGELARGISIAVDAAREGCLVAFGIEPSGPHRGYGYIQLGDALAGNSGASAIRAFHEKPDAQTAARLLGEGGWFWNSGMFLFRASDVLEEISAFSPEIGRGAKTAMDATERDGDFLRPEKDSFLALPSLAFDVAVMEKTARGTVVPIDPGWTDLGDWDAIQSVLPTDTAGNTFIGDVMAFGTRNSVVRSDGPLVAAVGIDEMVVIASDDAILVMSRGASQEVRSVVDRLRRERRPEADVHRTVHRPWGSYQSLLLHERCQVKEITVRPGAQLSLQLHRHRSEHWVVVSGAALVTIGDKETVLHEGESVYVPVGTPHRLANPGKIPLKLIEVQTGAYLGEDDIVRIEDSFGRK